MRLIFALTDITDPVTRGLTNSPDAPSSVQKVPPSPASLESSPERSIRELLSFEAAMVAGGSAVPVQRPEPSSPNDRSRVVNLNPEPVQWSSALQNVLDQPPSQLPIRLLLVGLLFGCVFGVWAWFGRIQEVSYAQGRLEPEGAVYKIQPVAQGEIAQILVKEGDTVEAGQVIAILDHRLAQAEVDRLLQSLTADQLQLSQIQGLMAQIRLELKTQQAISAADTQAQRLAIEQANTRADTAQQTVSQLQAETNAYAARLDRLQPLVEAGALSEEHLFEVEQALREYERSMIQQQGEVEQSLAESDRLQAGLSQKQAEGEQTELETQQRLQQLEREAADMAARMAENQTLLKAAQTKLEQMYLYAPVTGVISALAVQNAGEVVQPSQTVAEIAPATAPLVLSALLPNRDAGFVQEGMPVQIKLDAFPYQEYGIVPGRVVSISPDTRLDERLGAVYEVEVAIDSDAIDPDAFTDRTIQFKAGQTASAEIITRQRRVIDVLLDPIKKLQGDVRL